jgi:hypothetical protein
MLVGMIMPTLLVALLPAISPIDAALTVTISTVVSILVPAAIFGPIGSIGMFVAGVQVLVTPLDEICTFPGLLILMPLAMIFPGLLIAVSAPTVAAIGVIIAIVLLVPAAVIFGPLATPSGFLFTQIRGEILVALLVIRTLLTGVMFFVVLRVFFVVLLATTAFVISRELVLAILGMLVVLLSSPVFAAIFLALVHSVRSLLLILTRMMRLAGFPPFGTLCIGEVGGNEQPRQSNDDGEQFWVIHAISRWRTRR